MKVALKLSISRASSGEINIGIEDALSSIEFIDAKISCEEFAKAITGLSSRPMEAEIIGFEYVGKLKIREERKIECDLKSYNRNELEVWLKNNAQENGWILDSYLGSQSSISYFGDKKILNYAVYKYVTPNKGD